MSATTSNRSLAVAIAAALFAPQLAAAESADEVTTELDRVEVVGSRIKRVDLETSLPVFVLERAQIERTGLQSVGDILQDLTTHGAALNTTVNNGGTGETFVDLRNLGPNRTLVLVNGRRWITGIGGAVDLNSIPLSIIERIEVLKDGASALYGSDAIAGVINITTRDRYDGAESTAHLGENEYGDGRVESYDFTVGASGERSSVALNVSYLKQEPISAGDREISAVPTFGLPGNNVFLLASPTSPFGRFGFGSRGICPYDPTGNYPADGRCVSPVGRPPIFNRNTFDPATGTYPLFDPQTDGYNFAPENYLQTPQERLALYAQGRYDVTDTVRYTFEALYNERRSAQELAPIPVVFGNTALGIFRFTAPANSVYNPFGQPVTALAFRPGTARRRFAQDADTFRFGGGFDGTFDAFDRVFSWNAGYAYSEYGIFETQEGLIDTARIRVALGPSFRDAGGVARCGTPDAIVADCVPFDPYRGPDALTQEMLDNVYFTGHETSLTRTWNYHANLSGELLALPAGPLAFAAGYEYRRETGARTLDALDQQNIVLGGGEPGASFGGRTSVDETYLELSVPLLADAPLAEVLELSLAGRRSDYSSFGATTNLKGGFRWKPVEQLLVRGSYSEGFRAPNVEELFFPARLGLAPVALDDPCVAQNDPSPEVRASCAADGVPGGVYQPEDDLFRIATGGNPALTPETSVSRTLGLVWSPPWAPGLDLTLDWYRIRIDDAIATAADILAACAIQGVAGACERTTRDPATGQLLLLDERLLNSGGLSVEGYDLTVRYRMDTRAGRFTLLWDSTYNVEYLTEVPRGVAPVSATGNYFQFEPGWRIRSNIDIAWERGDFGAALGARYYSALDESCTTPTFAGLAGELCSNPDAASPVFFGFPENRIDSRWYFDLQGSWNAPWDARIAVGVQNVLDEDPPVSYDAFANSFDPAYPVPGRHWYATYTQKF